MTPRKKSKLSPDTPGHVRRLGRQVSHQHKRGHKNCPACSEANLLLVYIDSDFSRLPFPRAADMWLELRKRGHLKARTHETNKNYVESLGRFFKATRLCDITPGHLRAYQIARAANSLTIDGVELKPWKRRAGNSIITKSPRLRRY